jgi:hypothetical protein
MPLEISKDREIIYTPELDHVLCEKGEECQMYSRLHLMAYKKFRKREVMFNLPIITITAVIGFVSGLKLDFEYIHLILGGMSLYASLMKSYFSYLKISQKSENHRIAYIQYDQIHNEIRLELSLDPSIRKNANMMMDIMRIKLKNLREVSEILDNSIISQYKRELRISNKSETSNEISRLERIVDEIKNRNKLHEISTVTFPNTNSENVKLSDEGQIQIQTQNQSNLDHRSRSHPPVPKDRHPEYKRSQPVELKISSPIQTYNQLKKTASFLHGSEFGNHHPDPPNKNKNVYCDYPNYASGPRIDGINNITNTVYDAADSESESVTTDTQDVHGICV